MKRASTVLVVVLMLAVAMPMFAGEKGKKCEGSGEDCVKKMKAKYEHKAWLGIEYEATEHGRWAISKVVSDSPAEKAGFEKGDVILAVNGVEYSKENKKAVKAVYSELEPGSTATYVVKRQGGKVKLEATLGSVPKDLQKKWIQAHMTDYHPEMQMASK